MEEAENPTRGGRRALALISLLAGLFASVFLLSTVVYIPFQHLVTFYLGGSFTLIFLAYPLKRGGPTNRITPVDLLLSLAAIVVTAYFSHNYLTMQLRAGLILPTDVAFGLLAIVVALEAGRRVLGWLLPVLAVVLILFNLLGPFLPSPLNHAGFSLARIINNSYSATGIFGSVASAYARYVMLFVIFGGILESMGIMNSVMELADRFLRRQVGGTAKGAVVASGLMGSIMGSGVSNIALTGPLTIPAMKRSGFSPEKAGAIETVASIGGQLLPPVMGAGAFLVAQFAYVSYSQVVAMAIAPAILFYIGLYASVHFEAKRNGIEVAPGASGVRAAESHHGNAGRFLVFLPILVLMIAMVAGLTESTAVLLAIISAIALSLLRSRSLAAAFRQVWSGLVKGSEYNLAIASTAGVIGIIIAMLNLSGIPITFSMSMLSLSGDSLLLAFLLVVFVSLVMGMGMTATAAYVVVAILAAPVFVELGVPLLVAHLVVFWLSMDSAITPPFAIGAFVASGISGGNVHWTGIHAFRYGKALYLVPLAMLYTPLVTGSPAQQIVSFLAIALALVAFSASFNGYLSRRMGPLERILLAGSASMLFVPLYSIQVVGLVVLLAIWEFGRRAGSRRDPERPPSLSVAGVERRSTEGENSKWQP
jgi:TRAP transporter 4TM/12TM fusion protein